MKAAIALAMFVAVSAGAEDGGGRAGVDLTAGSNAYRSLRAEGTFKVRDDLFLAPRVLFYRSNDSNGTHQAFGLRGGYEPGRWSFGADAAVQPRVNGYERSSLGGDAAYSFPLAGAEAGTESVELGGGASLTRHADAFEASGAGGARGRGRGAARAEELVVRESDLFVFGTLRARAAALSFRASKSSYDRDLAAADVRRVLGGTGDGFDAAVFGFPDAVVGARLRIVAFPAVEPFAAVTRTTFELGDPPATSIEAGASAFRGRTGLTGSLEVYRQSGFAERRYLTLGASLDF